MVQFKATLEKLGHEGEKTGWTVVHIPEKIAARINPGVKKSYRVKGFLDAHPIEKVAMVPMGGGDYIIAINAAMRKAIRKQQGATVTVKLEIDASKQEVPADFVECLADEPAAEKHFNSLAPSHQKYFINWIESAKTDATRARRIALSINGLQKGWDYGQMIRAQKKDAPGP